MLRTHCDRITLPVLTAVLALALPVPVLAQATTVPRPPAPPAAPAAPRADALRVVSSEVSVSRAEAVLQLGLAGGQELEFAIRDGHMFADGRDLGAVPPRSAAERAWRDLLNRAIDTPAQQLEPMIRAWAPPAPDDALKQAMLSLLSGQNLPPAPTASANTGVPGSDTVAKLESKLEEMQQQLDEAEQHRADARKEADEARNWGGPFRHVWHGITSVMSTLLVFALLIALGFGTVFLGGRPRLEAIADTARRQTARSFVVGLAGSFLALPAYILGALALTISIVGIPILIVWIPLFPLAVILGALLGYLGVAHAAGESMAERRLYGGDWFSRGNSYYFIMTGTGLLLVLFIAAGVIVMAGPWLGFLSGLLYFAGVVVTWLAFTIGFGAVLLTRGGSRTVTGLAPLDADLAGTFEEETHV